MATEFLSDPRQFSVLLNDIHDAPHGKMGSLVVEKYMLIQAVWTVWEIGSQGLACLLLKKDCSLLVALAVNQHRACLKVNVRKRKPNQFCNADAGLEEELQDRVIAAVACCGIEKSHIFINPQEHTLFALLLGSDNSVSGGVGKKRLIDKKLTVLSDCCQFA